MSRPVTLPTPTEVEAVLTQLRADSDRPVTARALAEQLGLTNPTFWRHFRDIAQSVADERRSTLRATPEASQSATPNPVENVERRLRDENTALRAQLELAVAHIQRLTIENDSLREQAEQVAGLRRIPPS